MLAIIYNAHTKHYGEPNESQIHSLRNDLEPEGQPSQAGSGLLWKLPVLQLKAMKSRMISFPFTKKTGEHFVWSRLLVCI